MPFRPAGPSRAPLTLCAALLGAMMLGGCASDEGTLEDDTRPAPIIYEEADRLYEEGRFRDAVQRYDDIERLHPYSPLAKSAMLKSAQASYAARDYTQARLSAERFLNFYPADPEAAQAQYIIGASHYDQIVDIGRDQGETRQALEALREVINRYPDTEYARAAKLRYDLALDHLAGKEMEIGRWYLKQGHPVAAINRFRTVIETYQTTSHTPEALHRLVESYLILGLPGEAQTAAAILGYNFPGSPWYAASYDLLQGSNLAPADKSSDWLSRTYRQVVRGEWQ
jgi:outer membrane protein assembly factor BamD